MDSNQTATLTGVDGHGDAYTYDVNLTDCSITAPTITISDLTYGQSIYANAGPSTITLTDDVWNSGWNRSNSTLSLTGEDADIDINGVSLMETIRGIQDRLNILCPDPEMEAEWDDLREIRARYEAKLQECREKSRAWKALQQKG